MGNLLMHAGNAPGTDDVEGFCRRVILWHVRVESEVRHALSDLY